jgi:hypothetical protein
LLFFGFLRTFFHKQLRRLFLVKAQNGIEILVFGDFWLLELETRFEPIEEGWLSWLLGDQILLLIDLGELSLQS